MGIFTLAYALIDEKRLTLVEEKEVKGLLEWFKVRLPIPDKLSKNRNNAHKSNHGISWIKAESTEVVSKLWELKSVLENHGLQIEVVKTNRPGYLVYEDEHQIVATPFHGETI